MYTTLALYSGRFYNSVSHSSKSDVSGEKLKTCDSVRKSQYVSLTGTVFIRQVTSRFLVISKELFLYVT